MRRAGQSGDEGAGAALLLGIDEAGRGPVLGPLIICGCALSKQREKELAALGLKDSKVLPARERSRLAREIKRLADRLVVESLSPAQVDAACARGGLNQAETAAFIRIIRLIEPGEVYLDALTSRPARFGRAIAAALAPLRPKIVSENKADTKFPVVQAAAIVAKVTRDAALARLSRRFGDIGSGYPGDPRTVAFLKRFASSGDYPACVRRSWRTVERHESDLL